MTQALRFLAVPVVLLSASAVNANAQLISIRTAPVSVGEQFWIYPSQWMGMGGSLALQDLELDPFSNPATASRIGGALIASSPTLYTITESDGFGRTLPITVLGSSSRTFLGGSFAVQELESAFTPRFRGAAPTVVRSDRFAHNLYTFGLAGRSWPEHKLSIGLSGSYAKLEKVHAVDLLYPNSEGIEQSGHLTDLRLGLLKEFSGARYLEAVLVHNKVDMSHEVTYVDGTWAQGVFTPTATRRESNHDRTSTWGAHTYYSVPAPESRWRWATALTANVKTHPKIPNYEFMSIPRDPGNSYAFSFGLGAARQDTISRLSFDFAYEPIWTSTWAEATENIRTDRGFIIPKGAMTVENEFVFSNYAMHVGYARHWTQVGLQLGLGWRTIRYSLDQYNAITDVQREQDESWTEVTPTWGLTFHLPGFDLRYFGRRHGGGFDFAMESKTEVIVPAPDIDIVAAPSNPLSMDVTRVISHQIGISIPIGSSRSGIAKR